MLTIQKVLDEDQLAELTRAIKKISWDDGRKTAGAAARAVKRNEQANLSTGPGKSVHTKLLTAIQAHPVLKAAARPRRYSRLVLSRTGPGGGYGAHTDNGLMKNADTWMRSDLSFTLFLSNPAGYDGGELIIHTSGAAHSVKGEAGDLFLYPSSSVHEVSEVTQGTRLACVGWIESQIRSSDQREILFDLTNLRVSLGSRLPKQSAELITLDKSIANILRLWADP